MRKLEETKTYGCNERATNEGNHAPVESKDTHSQSSVRPEQRVNNKVIRRNPADPVEHAQRREQVTRNPVPHKAARHRDAKELFARNVSTIALAVVLVQGVEQRRVHQGTRPDHAARPDDELAQETAK